MYLTKEELNLIYNHLPDGELKNKIGLQIFVNHDIVEDIKRTFPDVYSIWKSDNSDTYYAKFYDDENDDIPFRIEMATKIARKYDIFMEIKVLEFDIKNKGTKDDWMYSECDLIWERS